MFQLLRLDVSCCNEELGELAYAALSNSEGRANNPDNYETIVTNWKFLLLYRTVYEDLKDNSGYEKQKSTWRLSVENDPEVDTLTLFLQEMLADLVAGSYFPYHSNYQTRKLNLPGNDAAHKRRRFNLTSHYEVDVPGTVDMVYDDMRRIILKCSSDTGIESDESSEASPDIAADEN